MKCAAFGGVEKPDLTSEQAGPRGVNEIAVGSDLVRIADDRLVVFARNEMVDWTVRDFAVVPIHFRGFKFYLKRRTPGPPPYAYHYELGTWHAGLGSESNRPIFYDEEYVAERDVSAKTERRHDHFYSALFVFYPFMGFFWSGFKERVLSMIGFEPVDTTEASIMVAFGYFLIEGVFISYFHAGFLGIIFGHSRLFALDWLLFILVPLDCAARYGHVIRGDSIPIGFLEWLFRRKEPVR